MSAPEKNGKTNAMRLLEQASVPYELLEYDTSDGLLDACSMARKIGRPPEQVFKTLVTTSGPREFFVFVVPGSDELDLKAAARAAGRKRIEMIPQKTLFPLTGYIHGGCSPVGMKKLFPTFIDETAQLFDRICVSGGKIGYSISVAPLQLADLVHGSFADITVKK